MPRDLLRYGSLEMRHLRLVLAVAEARGLTRAASRLRLTTSALSHQLRQLESLAGAPMFYRDGRSMRTTRAGETLVEAARRALEVVQDAEEHLRGNERAPEVIRLCTHCYTGYAWLPPIITAFMQKHGEIEVLIVPEATRRPFEALGERKVDLVLSHERPNDPGFTTRVLFRDEMLLLVAPDHRLASESTVSAEEFRHEHLILHPAAMEESQFYLEHLAPAGIRPRRFTGVMLTEAVIEMVRAGLGVTVLPHWTAAPFLLDGSVVAKRVTRHGAYRTWQSVTHKNPAHADALTALINDIATQMARKTNKVSQRRTPPITGRPRAAKLRTA